MVPRFANSKSLPFRCVWAVDRYPDCIDLYHKMDLTLLNIHNVFILIFNKIRTIINICVSFMILTVERQAGEDKDIFHCQSILS